MTDPGVTGDAQQSKAHLERHTLADRAKRAIAVGKVASIFPEEVADKGFGGILVASYLQEKVLEFSGDPSDIKDTISSFHPFQINPNDTQSLPKEEVRGSRVTVNEYLLVLLHTWLLTPALT